MTGAIAGLFLGLISWLVYAAVGYGGVNQTALFEVSLTVGQMLIPQTLDVCDV